jgi:hypothetical protein
VVAVAVAVGTIRHMLRRRVATASAVTSVVGLRADWAQEVEEGRLPEAGAEETEAEEIVEEWEARSGLGRVWARWLTDSQIRPWGSPLHLSPLEACTLSSRTQMSLGPAYCQLVSIYSEKR